MTGIGAKKVGLHRRPMRRHHDQVSFGRFLKKAAARCQRHPSAAIPNLHRSSRFARSTRSGTYLLKCFDDPLRFLQKFRADVPDELSVTGRDAVPAIDGEVDDGKT